MSPIFVLLSFVHLCRGTIEISTFSLKKAFDGKRTGSETMVSWSTVASNSECARHCQRQNECLSYFYNKNGFVCGILDRQLNESEATVTDLHFRYYTKNMEAPVPCCRYIPSVTSSGNPGLIVAENNVATLYDSDGDVIRTYTESTNIRALFYHPFKDRLYIGHRPVKSMKMDGTDARNHGPLYTGTITGFEVNPYDDSLYLSISADHVDRLSDDDVLTHLAEFPDVRYPRQCRLDTLERKLYWADESLKAVKSVNVEGTPVITTLFTTTDLVWGLDIDFDDRKIYWCAKSTGKVTVFDMDLSTNTVLVLNGNPVTGSCSGLRLYNNHIYILYYRLGYIEKRNKSGGLVEKILDGKLSAPLSKYFAIVQ